jgi:hypothetical protein
MVVDDLEERVIGASTPPIVNVSRALQVLAVGFTWSLPGMLFGLLVAAVSATWTADVPFDFGAIGMLLGAAIGVWLETTTGTHDTRYSEAEF